MGKVAAYLAIDEESEICEGSGLWNAVREDVVDVDRGAVERDAHVMILRVPWRSCIMPCLVENVVHFNLAPSAGGTDVAS